MHRDDSFNALFAVFPPQLFGGDSQQEMIIAIQKWYTPEDTKKYGVVGIQIELVR